MGVSGESEGESEQAVPKQQQQQSGAVEGEWRELPARVAVLRGSSLVTTKQDMRPMLRRGAKVSGWGVYYCDFRQLPSTSCSS